MFAQLWVCLFSSADIEEEETRLTALVSVLQSCPEPNRNTFLYLLHHLQRSDNTTSLPTGLRSHVFTKKKFKFLLRVSEKQATNKMSLMNLATVFGPTLLRPPVAALGHDSLPVDISQEVVVQVRFTL